MPYSPPSRRNRRQLSTSRSSKVNHTPREEARPASSPLRSYAKGKNSLWLLNSDTYSSVTMKMLIEKQAAAAASRLNSPSRLEAFAADSPPHRRRPRTPTKVGSGGGGGGRGGRSDRSDDRGRAPSPSPRHTSPEGGIALSELVSATTPPRRRSSAIKFDASGGNEGAELRRSLAQETYTKTFTGMQAYGESGMTVLEELIDAAFRACDIGHAQGQQRVTGAALLTRSGKIFAGCNVESSSVDLSVGAERTTVLKAVSEGETRFRSMAMASDTDLGFPSPDGPGRQFLAEFGEFPVYLVNRDMQVKIASTGELYPMMPPGPVDGKRRGLGPGEGRDEAIVAASREREKRPAREWGVQEVLDWLEDELELGEYRREFARAKVDGALLLNLEDKDLHDMLGIEHPLHRRRVCLGIQKIKDKEEQEQMGKNYADMDDYVKRLDRDRVRLVTKLKVVFDRFDKSGGGTISTANARDALLYMGRDVTGEACASWLADRERNRGDIGGQSSGISFVDFSTAYSALFADEDPDIDLGERRGPRGGTKEQGVSVTGSGHVRLRQKKSAQGHGDGAHGSWAPGSSEGEQGFRNGSSRHSPHRKTPRGGGGEDASNDGDDHYRENAQAEAFEALRSVKKLAEVKRVFDRFAVDGMLTAYEALQALTEAGCTAPRTHAGRYLRSRRFFGLRREVTFFEFLRSMAALGVHDSGAHVAGFAPAMIPLGGGGTNIPFRARHGSRGRRDDDDDDDDEYMSVTGKRAGGRSGSRRRTRRRGRSGEGRAYDDDDEDQEGSTSTSADDEDDRHRRSPAPRRGVSPRRGVGAGGVSRGRGLGSGSGGGYGETRRSRSARSRYGREGGKRLPSDESDTGGDGDRSDGSAFGTRGRGRRGSVPQEERDGRERQQTRSRGGGRETEDDDHDRTRDRDRHRDKHRAGGRPTDRDRPRERESERGSGSDGARAPSSARSHRKASSPSGDESNEGRSGQEARGGPASSFTRGDRVEARYRGRGTKFYKGTISRVNSNDTVDVAYDDGEKEIGIATEHVRSLEPGASRGGSRTRGSTMARGDRVEVRYRGKGTKFYKGKISRVNSDGTMDISYDDGEKEVGIAEEHVRCLEPQVNAGGGGGRGLTMVRGDRVEVRYRGKGTKFYKGKVSRVNSDDTMDIAYDDGEKEIGIAVEHVRSLESPPSPGGRGGSGRARAPTLMEGDKVEANFRGRGRFYPGRIGRVNLDGTFNIDYDDGEKERGVTDDLIRASDRGSSHRDEGRSGGSVRLERGDRVEARYRGRGTKFYKGKISRVNSDGTFDISYDDGEKEIGIASEHVRSLESKDSTGDNDLRGSGMAKGDRVEARYRGKGTKFYKGKISRVNSDATFDIAYDDGEKEIGIAVEHVRSLDRPTSTGGGGERRGRLERGDRVEARYRGKGTKFYKGKISRVYSDDTMDIAYDDGEKEIGIASEHVRSLDRPTSAGGRVRAGRMARGDRVEARYRGRGTKFYKGKISRVNSDDTFDIAYDDGEKEIGIAIEHVRSLDRPTSAGGGGERRGRLERGDRVEARYRGKGTKFYKGKISRVNSDDTMDIAYDDGEKEVGIAVEHVRSLEPQTNTSDSDTNGSRMAKGDRVEARYRGKGTKFYKGKISRVNSDATFDISYDDGRAPTLMEGDKVEANFRGRGRFYPGRIGRVNLDGTFNIDYDDGEKERGVTDDLIRASDRGSSHRDEDRSGGSVRLERGDRVEARYRGRGTKFYKGKISRVNSDGTFDISYDDGEKEIGIAAEHVRSLEPQRNADENDVRGSGMARGDRVEARYRGRGTKFYKGKISRVNSDDTFDIAYDDGEKEIGIAAEHVRSLDRPTSAGGGGPERRASTLMKGDKVEANFRGRGRFYPGRISKVNLDGTFNIDYDDGEKERGVTDDLIRASDRGSSHRDDGRSEQSSRLERGDRVEARYRGRGTKFYKGKISRVNSDNTMDIAYDDGEKEIGIAAEHVRPLEQSTSPSGRGGSGRGRAPTLMEGDKVEANFRGRGRFYPGRISRVNLDGTFNIDYDDGEKERGVTDDLIRASDRGSSHRDEGRRGGSARLERGDRVEARYRGRGTKFYKGKISRVNSDGTFDISYDDGEKEIGIAAEHVRSLKSVEAATGERGSKMARGDRVEARYRGKGIKFYKGKISRVNSDDTFDIAYDDGEKEIGIAVEHVRSLDRPTGAGGPGRGERMTRGDRVEARYRGRGTKFYKGKISRVNSDDTMDIAYDDGEKEVGIAVEHVRSLEPQTNTSDSDTSRSRMAKGDRVEVRYRGRGTKFYKGKISRVNSDATFDISYDDGEKEIGIAAEHVRPLESPPSPSGRGGSGRGRAPTLMEGDKVEANFRGRGRFYPGRISRVNLDGTFNIDYDDGEKERGVTDDLIRASDRGSSHRDEGRRGGSVRLERGDRVEARYRGRGTKFYKGKISRVNSDDTMDIAYDDGEKEIGIAVEHVRSLEPQRNADARLASRSRSPTTRQGRDDNASEDFAEGDKVEGRFRGRSRWFRATVERKNRDGTYWLVYADGDEERAVENSLIRRLGGDGGGGGGGGSSAVASPTSRFKAMAGRVSARNTIDDEQVPSRRGIQGGEPNSSRRDSGRGSRYDSGNGVDDGDGPTFLEGDLVEGNFQGRGRFYSGRISRINLDGTFNIDYSDGEKERGVKREMIRSVDSIPAGARRSRRGGSYQ
ncbi:unnamed protein product [Ectocarpus sp. 6 AP-2014]